MRLPEPLRYSPFHSRKPSSLRSLLFGDRPSAPLGPAENAYGQGATRPTTGHSPPVYMSGSAHEYVPEIELMHVPASDYDPYDGTLSPTRPTGPTELDEIRMASVGRTHPDVAGPEVKYEDGLMDEDFFALQMKLADGQFDGLPIVPENNSEAVRLLLRASAVTEPSEFERELQAHLWEIDLAARRLQAESFPDSGPALPHEVPYGPEAVGYQPEAERSSEGALDPSRYDLQDFLNSEMADGQLPAPDLPQQDFGASIDALFDAQEALFRSPTETADLFRPGHFATPESASLEQIVAAHDVDAEMMPDDEPGGPDYDGSQMTPELFEQQMQDAIGAMGPQGSYADPALLGYGPAMPETYDEQMQRMLDPYAVRGMYGPMLPGPMPDLGPGGGP